MRLDDTPAVAAMTAEGHRGTQFQEPRTLSLGEIVAAHRLLSELQV